MAMAAADQILIVGQEPIQNMTPALLLRLRSSSATEAMGIELIAYQGPYRIDQSRLLFTIEKQTGFAVADISQNTA